MTIVLIVVGTAIALKIGFGVFFWSRMKADEAARARRAALETPNDTKEDRPPAAP